jgi:hypothetical protein
MSCDTATNAGFRLHYAHPACSCRTAAVRAQLFDVQGTLHTAVAQVQHQEQAEAVGHASMEAMKPSSITFVPHPD